jgi:hypothetical protein
MLWAWLAGWQRRSMALSALAGALLVIGSTFSLIHIWVALVVLAATLWQDRERWQDELIGGVLPAVMGGVIVVLLAWRTFDFNIPLSLLKAQQRWSAIQKTFQMNHAIWYAIGLPIFLLFLSPGLWTLAGLSLRRRRLNFGTRLALCTAITMAFIYLVLGVTYELPRLWVAFLPPLTLGLAIDWPLLRGKPHEHPRVARALLLVVFVQIFFTAFHWTFFDAREAEYRLSTQRFYQ